MADRTGQQLGNYRLVRLIGQGGFAEVYLGQHVYLDTQAAIKVLHTQLAQDGIEQFRLEAKRIAHLEHPYIVRVLDFGVEGPTPFLVMSYASGGTLRQRHPRGSQLPLPLVVQYVKQAADALQYAHDEKFIHRDIKPENMLLGRRNEVLLSDFGIATIVHSTTSLSMQAAVGTVPYMAPEQLQEQPRPASDQYSLGVVVYEWLSGSRPFDGSFTEIVVKHLTIPPPPLRVKMPTIAPEIEQVVMTALAKDYKQRFANVQAFVHALEQASQLALSRSVLPPTEIRSSSLPAPLVAPTVANWPSQAARPTEIYTPASQPPAPTEMATPPGAGSPPFVTKIALNSPGVVPKPFMPSALSSPAVVPGANRTQPPPVKSPSSSNNSAPVKRGDSNNRQKLLIFCVVAFLVAVLGAVLLFTVLSHNNPNNHHSPPSRQQEQHYFMQAQSFNYERNISFCAPSPAAHPGTGIWQCHSGIPALAGITQ